jgi:hypothetical protein
MQLFKCSHCSQPIYFENLFCGNCGSSLGFLAEPMRPIAIEPDSSYRYCANHEQNACNWLISENNPSPFCRACELNHTIPDLSNPDYLMRWRKLETAKHRMIYSLLKMNLPLMSKGADKEKGLAFDFVADLSEDADKKIFTGYAKGLITINIAEADDIEREMARRFMHEAYRTLLGHFRHEIGHYYWERLIDGTDKSDPFRQLFGDERADYQGSLKNYYRTGPPADWNEHYISAYASAHPWEDWAETWAHYMHIVDTLETAYSFGLSIDPLIAQSLSEFRAEISANPYHIRDFNIIIQYWVPITFAMNSLNRSMGLGDIYPFVISNPVKEKMAFIHGLIRSQSRGRAILTQSQS